MPRNVYIVGCVRTPIGRGRDDGILHSIHPIDLYAMTLEELMKRTKVAKHEVEDVITGCATPMLQQGGNIARLAILKANFPVTVSGVQLNRLCGSGQQAIHFAYQAIAAEDMDVVIAGGVEMMGTVPMGSDYPMVAMTSEEELEKFKRGFPVKLLNQGVSAELIAEKWKLNRTELDEFSAQSHEKCAYATKKGYFDTQILPIDSDVNGQRKLVKHDEGFRVPVDRQRLSQLKAVFKENGVIHAGNASQISDGAAAVMLVSEEKLKLLKLKPRARIVATVAIGSDPELMLTGPIPATQKVLKKANLKLDDIDIFEINEAFASVVLAWAKELKVDMRKVNPNGGAIAHGHPLGATGAILMTKLVHELERTGARYGLQVMCIGYGQATATIIERVGRQPVKIHSIRARRDVPGLKAQHVCGIRLIRSFCHGHLIGDKVSSTEIEFYPSSLLESDTTRLEADIKTAGSTTLLMQQILPCLLFGKQTTTVILKGGTNADMAPQIDYVIHILLPILQEQLGIIVNLDIVRRGYFPKGGGELHLQVTPIKDHLNPVRLNQRGQLIFVKIRSFVAGSIPLSVAERMSSVCLAKLRNSDIEQSLIHEEHVREDPSTSFGDGTGIIVWCVTTTGCRLAGSALGRKGKRAEQVGQEAAEEFLQNWTSQTCVDQYLQDQLILFMALAEGTSQIVCGPLTLHTQTAIHFAKLLTGAQFDMIPVPDTNLIEVHCQGIGFNKSRVT